MTNLTCVVNKSTQLAQTSASSKLWNNAQPWDVEQS